MFLQWKDGRKTAGEQQKTSVFLQCALQLGRVALALEHNALRRKPEVIRAIC